MARPRIIDVDYQEFLAYLRKAVDMGKRIDPTEKTRWASWVKDHNVREAAFKAVGDMRFEGLQPVIIDDAGDWGGYFLYSKDEEACIKWMQPTPPGD